MERQLRLDLKDREERKANFDAFIEPLGFTEIEVLVLELLHLDGDQKVVNGQHVSELRCSRDEGGIYIGKSKNTFKKAVDRLVARGLCGVIAIETPWRYVINWTRLAKYEPPNELDPLFRHPVVRDAGHPPVTAGHSAPDSLNREIINLPVPEPCTLTPRGQPWSKARGFTSDELRAAVARRDLAWLKHLFGEAVRLGWATACDDDKLRFLTLCHHVTTSSGIHEPRAALIARMKRRLDCDRVRQASDQWAQGILRSARGANDLRERLCTPGGHE